MNFTLIAIYWTAFVLWVCFNTSAVYEYIRLLPLPEFLTHAKEYRQFRKSDPALQYGEFMLTRHSSFLVRLFSCPFCVGIWVSLAASWCFDSLFHLPVVYGGGLAVYLLFAWFVRKITNA